MKPETNNLIMTKKVLVTGGSGYIGSHTVIELQKSGYEPLIIDNLSNSDERMLGLIARISGQKPLFERIDLCDRKGLMDFFSRHRDIAGIIHFAALKAVGESVAEPVRYYHNNITGLLYLLEAMQEHDINRLVFSSSCTVYGQPEQLPVTEDAPVQQAVSPYGNTKQIAEEIIHDSSQQSKLRAISLRYFNPIGAHESGLIGELPLGVPNNLIPYITQTAIGKRKELRVWGKDYNTPDGTCIRDYIHVSDLAQAHLIALERLMKGENEKPHEYFNLGTGEGYSVLEAIQAFEKVSGVKLNWAFYDRRPGDVEKVYADTTLANLKLGWKAEKGLDEMMASAWKWEKNLAAGILD